LNPDLEGYYYKHMAEDIDQYQLNGRREAHLDKPALEGKPENCRSAIWCCPL